MVHFRFCSPSAMGAAAVCGLGVRHVGAVTVQLLVNPEFALTSSIWCSCYFAQGAHCRWGDALVSIAELYHPARSHVASLVRTASDRTITKGKLVVSSSCLLSHALVLWQL